MLYQTKFRDLLSSFESWQITQVPKTHNAKANFLAKLASVLSMKLTKTILVEYLEAPSIQGKVSLPVAVEQDDSKKGPIIQYL